MKRILSGLLLIAAGCGVPTATGPDVVARLGERDVTYADFEDYLRLNSLDGEIGLASSVLTGLFDQFLFEELLLLTADDEGITGSDRRRVVDRLISRHVAGSVSSESIAAYHERHPAEFNLSERVSLRQILVNDRRQAESALAKIRGGERFEAVARSLSDGQDVGGWEQADLGREDVPPAFADTIFALEEGEVSEIVEAEYGFLIFEVTRHQPAELLPLDSATPSIRAKLERDAADSALRELVAAATERYNVAVFEQNLPFDYQGNYRRNAATS